MIQPLGFGKTGAAFLYPNYWRGTSVCASSTNLTSCPMALKDQVAEAMKTAMKAKDKASLTALRSVKSKILLAETEIDASDDGLTEAQELQLLTKEVKQRRDSLEIYRKEGRDDLADKEQAEIDVIEQFLPQQMTADELTQAIAALIDEVGAAGMKDMGKVMGLASQRFAGKADNKQVADLVKARLAGK